MPIRFGDFILSEAERTLTRGSTPVHLTPKAFELLLVLASEMPRVVTKSDLHARVWPDTFVSDATLVGVIKELRRALDQDGQSDSFIRTVNRVGYALTVPSTGSADADGVFHWFASNGRHFSLTPGQNWIGRNPASAVFLDGPGVSRTHACAVVSMGVVTLQDSGSKNGTRVGGETLHGPVVLRDGDRIDVGTEVLVYRCSSSGLSTESISIGRPGRDAKS